MKTWTTPTVNELAINMTQDEWKPQASLDGAYLGDGKFSGWFGEPDDNENNGNGGNENSRS